eukprot:gene26803-29448_t
MSDPLLASLHVAGAGLAAQSTRLRVVSENIANASSTARTPGGDPYARKTITFSAELDRVSGNEIVRVSAIGVDRSPFRLEHEPSNPGADADGNVKMPNVNTLIEMADMREANRAYEANVQVIKEGRDLLGMTIDLLRSNS